MKKIAIFLLVFVMGWGIVNAQNFGISDVETHTPDPSAVLDVYSTTKGMLVPRMTTDQRLAIQTPANGLLVYDTDIKSFCYYDGSKGLWKILTTPDFNYTDQGFYTEGTTRWGVGTSRLNAKLTVQGDSTLGDTIPIFEVKNAEGKTILAVYNNGVRIYVEQGTTKGVPYGFAVGGYSSTKQDDIEPYLLVTKDSTRVYFNNTAKGVPYGFAVGGYSSTKAVPEYYLAMNQYQTNIFYNKAAKGVPYGFAVGGYSSTKGVPQYSLLTNIDSTRILYNTGAKGVPYGFAVGGYSSTKALPKYYFISTKDSTRIYFDNTAKGVPYGFAVGGYSSTKGAPIYYMGMSADSTRIFTGNGGFGVADANIINGVNRYFFATKPEQTLINFYNSDPYAEGFKIIGLYDTRYETFFSVAPNQSKLNYHAVDEFSGISFGKFDQYTYSEPLEQLFMGNYTTFNNPLVMAQDFAYVGPDSTITPTHSILKLYPVSAETTFTLNQTQPIKDGQSTGQLLTLQGPDDFGTSYAITLLNQGNVKLTADFIFRTPNDILSLYWDGLNWVEISRTGGQ